jgi:hypothetical protein
MPRVLETPHPVPNRLVPALAGTAVIVVALPVFVLAGWPLGAWGFGALLWGVFQLIGILLGRLPMGMGTLGTTGVAAFGRMFRVIALMTILIVVTTHNQDFGLSAALMFAIAFTVEFGVSLASYANGEPFPTSRDLDK